jgi:hypothetical protein
MREDRLFDFSFNPAVKLRAETPRVTADAGVLLIREADHRLGLTDTLADRLHDHRAQRFVRYPLAELLRERLYAFALGFSRQDDADRLAHDPAFRTAVWDRPGCEAADERLASQPTASRLVSLLAGWHNREELRHFLHQPVLRHQRQGGGERKVRLGVVDIDGFPVETHGEQQGAVYNGYYQKTVYSPLVASFSPNGDFASKRLGTGFIHAILRDGNAAPAEGIDLFLQDALDKARTLAKTVAIRLDAGFAAADILNQIDRAGARFAVRLPSNAVLDRLAAPWLSRPAGRPPKDGYEFAVELGGYKNPGWDKAYRVVLVVVDKPDKNGCLSLFPNYFFIVTNWPPKRMSPWKLLEHYRQRGTFEDRLGEWNALGVNLSQDAFAKNEVTLLLSLLAFNLLEVLRREMESAADPRPNPPASPEADGFDMTRFRNVVLKAGAVLIRGGRRLWFDLAEGIAPLWLALLSRIRRWRNAERPIAPNPGFLMPPPSHAFLKFHPRM